MSEFSNPPKSLHVTDLIRQTLDALFARYRGYTRTVFFLSFSVVLAIALITLVVIFPVFLLMGFLEIGTNTVPILQQMYYPESLYRIRLQNFAYATNLFGMAIFGYYLLRPDAESTPPQSAREILTHVPSRRWPLLLVLLGSLYVFYVAAFPYLFNFNYGNDDAWIDVWSLENAPWGFLEWFNSFFELLKDYLPVLLVFPVLIALYEGRLRIRAFRKYAPAMLASFILIFAFDAVWLSVRSLFQTYFMGLISLPFPELLYPTLLGSIAELALVTFFAVANAIALVYPFSLVHQASQPQAETGLNPD